LLDGVSIMTYMTPVGPTRLPQHSGSSDNVRKQQHEWATLVSKLKTSGSVGSQSNPYEQAGRSGGRIGGTVGGGIVGGTEGLVIGTPAGALLGAAAGALLDTPITVAAGAGIGAAGGGFLGVLIGSKAGQDKWGPAGANEGAGVGRDVGQVVADITFSSAVGKGAAAVAGFAWGFLSMRW
jgi:hypothetical protein